MAARLSSRTHLEISRSHFFAGQKARLFRPGGELSFVELAVRITRPEFEAAVRPRVADTLSALDRAIASASLSVGDLAGSHVEEAVRLASEQVRGFHCGDAHRRLLGGCSDYYDTIFAVATTINPDGLPAH